MPAVSSTPEQPCLQSIKLVFCFYCLVHSCRGLLACGLSNDPKGNSTRMAAKKEKIKVTTVMEQKSMRKVNRRNVVFSLPPSFQIKMMIGWIRYAPNDKWASGVQILQLRTLFTMAVNPPLRL
mmetsp:Transcript_547/g.866  ORF Transcript_547/g.866 Transcript_547/m.866 type:complete len:123 (-) Transcript_547:56-424(-)